LTALIYEGLYVFLQSTMQIVESRKSPHFGYNSIYSGFVAFFSLHSDKNFDLSDSQLFFFSSWDLVVILTILVRP
jgi:hypothetical protein